MKIKKDLYRFEGKKEIEKYDFIMDFLEKLKACKATLKQIEDTVFSEEYLKPGFLTGWLNKRSIDSKISSIGKFDVYLHKLLEKLIQKKEIGIIIIIKLIIYI